MKKILLSLIGVLALSLSFQSCNEEIELIGDYEQTAVIYGLLDQSDSVHMIKITRAFVGPGNANEIAQIPDSNYFNSVVGTVKEYVNGTPMRTFTLKDTIVENKETNGAFYAPYQKLYYFTTDNSVAPLLGNATYKLDLDINNGEFKISGSTVMVNGITNSNISGSNQQYRFIDNNGEYMSTSITMGVGTSYRMNTKIDIEFTEWEGTNPTVRHAIWNIGEGDVSPGEDKVFVANGAAFYSVVAANCSSNPAITRRTLNSMTAIVTGAASDLVEYMNVNEPSSSLAQSKPTFTNLTATNGARVVGIFSARQTVSYYKPFYDISIPSLRCLSKPSTQALCLGPVTGGLFFCSDHPSDIASNESYICN